MKKIFTLLAFLVVTVNAAAQEDPNNPTCFDVANPVSPNLHINDNVLDYLRGVADDERLNLCGYVFYFKAQSTNQPWKWIVSSTLSYSRNNVGNWTNTHPFKGSGDFFGSGNNVYPFCAYKTSSASVKFIITNCSGIDVFLYHNTKNSGTFSITATPQDESNNVLSISETLSSQKTYFPSLYGLDKTKTYQVELSIPANTCFYEISFLKRDFRKHDITIGNSNWATMYLDFPVRIPKTEHQNLDVFTIDAIDNDNRVVTGNVYDYIPANTGVLLHEDVPNHKTITFIETGKPLDGIGSNWLKGTTIDLSKADNYGLQEDEYALTLGYNQGNLGFFVYKGETIGANKAFLVTSDFENFSKGFYISDFEEFTDIQTVESECTETGNWYSLQGVRLNARPTQRGIYLNNGKKVIVK